MEKQQGEGIASPRAIVPRVATPQLSICIVNWNCRDYLRCLLQSLQAEREGLPLEIIVLDNASTDDSARMVESEFPEVHLIRNLYHQGVAQANNRAAARARSDLLFFLNNIPSSDPGR